MEINQQHILKFIETVEREAWVDMFLSAPQSYVQNSKLSYTRLGTSVCLADQGVPIDEFNRVISMGIEDPITEAKLVDAIAWMNEHAAPDFSFQIAPTASPESFQDLLEKYGIEKSDDHGWAKFYRDASPVEPHPVPTSLEVRLVEPHHVDDFGKTAQMGFCVPESMATLLSSLAGRPNWRIYAAYDGDVPVASGAMYIENNWAWFGVDATLADYRGRGAQYALIQQRLTDGIAAGVTDFTVETRQPAPGKESTNKSYCNYHRAGFKHMYTRPNYRLKKLT